MVVRRFERADAPMVCEIFYRSVHEVACAKYDEIQINAWAPQMPEPERWIERFREYDTFVADNDAGQRVGFIAMNAAGYVDMLYCLPEATRCGVSTKLYAAVERSAMQRGLTRLTAHASLLAQPFFKKHGWVIEKHETVVRNGVNVQRAEMSKILRI